MSAKTRERPPREEYLRRLPKTDLHCHVAGTLSARTMTELAAKNDVRLPTTEPDELYAFADFYAFLDVVRLAARCLVEREDFVRVGYEALAGPAGTGNLRYAEMFFNPTDYAHCGSYGMVVDGFIEGMRAAEADHGVVGRLIPSFNRELGPAAAREVVETVVAHPREEILGIGMDGAERAGPPALFAEAYRMAAGAGLRRTAHVCEDNQTLAEAPPSHVTDCLDVLGCDRLDHGYNVLADPGVAARCAGAGVPFVVCSHTCVPHRLPTRWQSLREMREAGLNLIVSTDDPPMYGTDIGQSYVTVAAELALTPEQAAARALAGVDASWLDETDKRAMRAAFTDEIARLDAADAAEPAA